MNISPINYNNLQKTAFGHHSSGDKQKCTPQERAIVAATSAAGVAASLAVLAKTSGYSLNPAKMFKNFKKSYIATTPFLAKEICSMGVGTCLGGLAGGFIIDQDKNDRKAKMREAVMQIGNITIPISTVAVFNKLCRKHGKLAQSVGSLAGIFAGVYLANFLMNKLGNFLFNSKNELLRILSVNASSVKYNDHTYLASTDRCDFSFPDATEAPADIPGLELLGTTLKGCKQPRATDTIYYYAGTVHTEKEINASLKFNTADVNVIVDMKPVQKENDVFNIQLNEGDHFIVISATEPINHVDK